ncbi:MAG: hypothetical protein AAF413_01375 [Patescibacteria group bacterium]
MFNRLKQDESDGSGLIAPGDYVGFSIDQPGSPRARYKRAGQRNPRVRRGRGRVVGIRDFQPGDNPADIDHVQTVIGGGLPVVAKREHRSNPTQVHAIPDTCVRIADIAHRDSDDVIVRAANSGTNIAPDSRLAEVIDSHPLSSVLDSISDDVDVTLVASAFIDEYDHDSNTFEWESPLQGLFEILGQNLVIIRATSQDQRLYPNCFNDPEMVRLSAEFAETARRKSERIANVLSGMRHVTIDASTELQQVDEQLRQLLTEA